MRTLYKSQTNAVLHLFDFCSFLTMPKLLASTLLLLFVFSATAQSQTVRIQIVGGANLLFNVNSYSKVKNGITYIDFTTIRVYYSDVNEDGTPNTSSMGWELMVNAATELFMPDYGTVTMPLSVLKINSKCAGKEKSAVLGIGESLIAEWLPGMDVKDAVEDVVLSYELGTNKELFGYSSDYFSTDLVFTLKSR